jgi:hypothetical protein
MTNLDASQTPPSDSKLTTSRSPLARLAGPLALSAGPLMVVVEVVIFPIVIGGLVGFQSLLPPFGIPLGIAMAWLGIWMIRTPVPAGATEAVS